MFEIYFVYLFLQICDRITTNLFTVNKAATTLEKNVKQLGTPNDSQVLRERMYAYYSGIYISFPILVCSEWYQCVFALNSFMSALILNFKPNC